MRRRAAFLSLTAGLAVMAAAQIAAPFAGVPLYDGVIVQDPYRYLSPGSNQAGSPTDGHASVQVSGPLSPQVAAATGESPPQAQLISAPGTFAVPASARTLTLSIKPVPVSTATGTERIVGNVYRFAAVDDRGEAIAIGSGTGPTVVLRAPQGALSVTIGQLVDGSWQDLPTQPSALAGFYAASVKQLGDFALLSAPPSGPSGLDPIIIQGVVLAVVALLVGGTLFWQRRQRIGVPGRPRGQRTPPPTPTSRRRLRVARSRVVPSRTAIRRFDPDWSGISLEWHGEGAGNRGAGRGTSGR